MEKNMSSLLLLKEDHVSACWSHSYDRKRHSHFDAKFDELWEEMKRNNCRLYNETKFRLDSWKFADGRLHFNLGLTSYKEYVCTNQAPFSQELIDEGLKIYGSRQAFMADPVAVGVYLETIDNKLVLVERSKWCGEAEGLTDRPGGHPEPKELLENPSAADLELQSSQSVVSEIFSSIQKEIRDEVNIAMKYLSSPLLMCIFRNSSTAGRPILDFYIRCSLPGDEVVSLYREGTQSEADESTNIILIDREELFHEDKLSALYNFSPSFKTSLPLYQAFMRSADL